MSLLKYLVLAALAGGGVSAALADTLQLKDAAAVTGKILAEKPDALVVDLGYTVLVIPRNAITGVTKAGTAATTAATAAPAGATRSQRRFMPAPPWPPVRRRAGGGRTATARRPVP